MATATFLVDALVAQPAETAAWLEQSLHSSCDAVASDVASAITALKLARDLGIKQCRASALAQTKLGTAAVEGSRNVAAGLDAIASLCGSALTSSHEIKAAKAALEEGRRGRHLVLELQQAANPCWSADSDMNVDADADAGGLDFGQWVDVQILDGCQFACVLDKGKDKDNFSWPRGRHSFTLHASATTPDSTLPAQFWLPPDAVAIHIHGDDAATCTWTCAQHPDGRGIVATYTAASQAAEVELTVHVFGTAVFTQRLVMDCAFARLFT